MAMWLATVHVPELGGALVQSAWPQWSAARDAEFRARLQVSTRASQAELRLAFVAICVELHASSLPWWRRLVGWRSRLNRFVEVATAYHALRDDPLKWDPDEFWERRRCALSRDACGGDDFGRSLRHPLSIGMLRSVFRSPTAAAEAFASDVDDRLPAWLSRRIESAAAELRTLWRGNTTVEDAAARVCVATAEALGSRRPWPRLAPDLVARWSERVRRFWILEVLAYVLRAEFLNSTAIAVYVLAFVILLARRCAAGDERSLLQRCLLAWDAAADSLSRHEVRVAVFAALASASWLALGDALELVRRAQQVAFACWALRWTSEAAVALDDARRRAARLAVGLVRAVRAQENQWRADLAALGHLVADLAAPLAVFAAALAFGLLCVAPLRWGVGLVAHLDPARRQSTLDGLLELLAADDSPTRRSVFAMNALLVATTFAPLANADARRSAKAALAQLAVQLKRRLYDKPVPPRKPDADDCCAICLSDFSLDHPDDIAYCRYGCGRPVHKSCMCNWLAQKPNCVFCGVQWS